MRAAVALSRCVGDFDRLTIRDGYIRARTLLANARRIRSAERGGVIHAAIVEALT
jgi:hypothetical protein